MNRLYYSTSNRPARSTMLLVLVVAILLLLLGGASLQQAGEWGGDGSGPVAAGHTVGHEAVVGQHLPAFAEASDMEGAAPVDSEHLTTLALGLFLVSLCMLLGAGLAARVGERRLLESRRLPALLPLLPSRPPLSALEVFRL
ncbi:hypothetical protein [Rubrobacter aplysinae]|uniref:hypothetical protein n=1 Tax=Rubrobacter aplysinae TaxID=909625 RepID=UPI00128E57AB|nr:hypothetical protein [Rubrobacter aplysinae]